MNEIDKRIHAVGIVPVIRLEQPRRDAAPLARALCAGGVPVAEVTFRAPGADEAMGRMVEACPDMLVGAGTVLTTRQVELALGAGASFIVTPGFDPELVGYCRERGVPIYPGCTTATDYHAALKFGLEVLKFFPAEQSGGLAKIRAMSAPFPMVKVMPTGGITLNNLKDYISTPGVLACGGSYMVSAELVGGQKWDEITQTCKKSVEIVKEARTHG